MGLGMDGKYWAVLPIFLLLLGLVPVNIVVPAESQTENFTIRVLTRPSTVDPKGQRIVNMLQTYFDPLNVRVVEVPALETVFFNKLLNQTSEWDMAISPFRIGERFDPALIEIFHPDFSTFARKYTDTIGSQLFTQIGLDQSYLSLIENAYFTFDPVEEKNLLLEFQKKFNEEWLTLFPLLSPTDIIYTYKELANFKEGEDISNMVFSGLKWNSNPEKREENGGRLDNLRLIIQNTLGNFNPLITTNNPDYDPMFKLMFPQLLLFDSEGNHYPHLVVSYDYKIFDNNSSEIIFKLRNDAKWLNKDGIEVGPITAKDVKFTFDMARFPWVGAFSNNLIDRITEIELVNTSSVKFEISRAAPSDLWLLSTQPIVPESELNKTLTFAGVERGTIYGDKINPMSSDQWLNFAVQPITGSMYYFQSNRNNVVTLKENPSFWYPTKDDAVSFNGSVPSNNFFFNWNDNPSTPTTEKPTGAILKEISFTFVEDKIFGLVQFDQGLFDIFQNYRTDAAPVYSNDPDFVVKKVMAKRMPDSLLINFQNNLHLRNYEIRKALLSAINKTEMAIFIGNGQDPQFSPISKAYAEFYTDSYGITYNYTVARDLFRKNGYLAEENSVRTITVSTPSVSFLPLSIVVFAFSVTVLFRRKLTTRIM